MGNHIYVSQGYNRQGGGDSEVVEEFRSTYRYDPKTDSYTRVADAPETGCYVASGPYKGKVYAVPGSYHEYGFHGDYHWADGALVYDPAADRWTWIDARRAEKRVFFLTQCSASVVEDGKVWIVGGMADNRKRTVVTEYFDIEKAVFVRGPDIAYGRCCGGGGIVGGLLTIMGGFVDGKGLGTPALPTWILDTRQYK
jgi:N-acetylneuraminic acid mutarotase